MGFKYYSGMIMQMSLPTDVDYGDITQWQCNNTAIEGKVRLDTYIGTSSTVYVPRLNGSTVITPSALRNINSITSVDCQNVPPASLDKSFSFYNCVNIRSVVNIHNSITNMKQSFQYCYNFNYSVKLPQNTVDMDATFWNCTSLNCLISIPNKVQQMHHTFGHCSTFNQTVIIPDSVTNMNHCFVNAYKFNQPTSIPDSVVDMTGVFQNCNGLNSPIIIGNGINISLFRAFESCSNFSSTVTIYSTEVKDTAYMFNNTSKSKEVYVYYKYANGVDTRTYNSIKSRNNVNGIRLYDLGTAPW